MKTVLFQLLIATVFSSAFLLMHRLISDKISARSRYLAGLILTVAFLLPLRFSLIPIELSADIPALPPTEPSLTDVAPPIQTPSAPPPSSAATGQTVPTQTPVSSVGAVTTYPTPPTMPV